MFCCVLEAESQETQGGGGGKGSVWEHVSVNHCRQQKKKESSAASRDVNLRLYIPCRTECVWSCLGHRLGSRGVYGR